VQLTGEGTREIMRAIRRGQWPGVSWRQAGWRKLLPAGVAATAALGVAVGGGVAVLGHPPASGGPAPVVRAAAPASASSAPAAVATLPPVQPVTSNAPVVSYLPDTTESVESTMAVPVASEPGAPAVAPYSGTRTADLIVVSPSTLPASVLSSIRHVGDVTAAEPVEAVRIKAGGSYTAVLGVDPSGFRSFAATATAKSDALWSGVADGGIAVSYTMGKLDKLPLGGKLAVAGKVNEKLKVVAFGTLGISGVDAVVSHDVARGLGAPANNAVVISVRGTGIAAVASAVSKLLPKGAGVQQLVSVVTTGGATGTSGAAGSGSSTLSGAPASAINAMLAAAMGRQGLPYVWGGNGPNVFDCSGLVQWSFRQAGITMPRVAADQALTGPAVPMSQLQPGDLLFYHTDATAPNYISHVAIYLGNGWMIQAPQPGENVEVVPAAFGGEFAGAVRVNPAQAAAVAAHVA
jgi:cell wall-associated NlpC family hydrolase